MAVCFLAVILLVLIVLLVVLLIVLVTVILVVLLVVLVTVVLIVLIIHISFLRLFLCGNAARIVYPGIYDLSFALKIRPTKAPNTMAAVMPPAAAFRPPVNIPKNPSVAMVSFTPLAKV